MSRNTRPATVSPSSLRSRVQCPICSMHLPAAHIQQHAAACGVTEEKKQDEGGEAVDTTLQVVTADRRRHRVTLSDQTTVAQLHAHVATLHRPAAAFELLAGFPPKALSDGSLTLKAAGLCGASVQQRCTQQQVDQATDSSQHAAHSKRKRTPQSPDQPVRKQTARERTRQTSETAPQEEEKEQQEKQKEERIILPLAFISSPPPAASRNNSPFSHTTQTPTPTDTANTAHKRRRIERGVITTFPPSSPVLGYGSDSTPSGSGRMGSISQLSINIPSPSPPPLSPAYSQWSPRTTTLPSSAPTWLSYRITAIAPSSFQQLVNRLPERTSRLTFLTFNVWFEETHQRTRITALAALITALQPDIIALQEVTPAMLVLIQQTNALRSYYLSPHPTSAPYFTLLASKRPPIATYRIPFISQMGRDLTAMVVDVRCEGAEGAEGAEGEVRRLIVSTSHLESLWQSRERREQQLKQALTTLTSMAAHPHTASSSSSSSSYSFTAASASVTALPSSTSLFFMGDTNLKAGECAALITSQHFIDLYPTLTNTHPSNDRAGYTYDTVVNRMVASRGKRGSRARYDRVLGRVAEGVEVVGMRRVGMEPIRDEVWISDHFGLLTELTVS